MTDGENRAQALIARLERRVELLDARFEGARIRWRRIGEGRPLVLLHGGNGSWLHWVRNVEALAERHQLWLPDLPGCGDSDEIAPPPTLERLVAALRHNIADLIGAQREIDLAGFSFGSVLASNLALARGGVRRLALLGATGHGQPRRPLALRNWRALAPGAAQDEAHRHNLAELMLHEPAAVDALALLVHRSASERTRLRSKLISHTDATRRALEQLDLPVLLAWGERDPTAGSAATTAQALAQGRGDRQWQVLPGAGHWVQYERAGEISALLASWLA